MWSAEEILSIIFIEFKVLVLCLLYLYSENVVMSFLYIITLKFMHSFFYFCMSFIKLAACKFSRLCAGNDRHATVCAHCVKTPRFLLTFFISLNMKIIENWACTIGGVLKHFKLLFGRGGEGCCCMVIVWISDSPVWHITEDRLVTFPEICMLFILPDLDSILSLNSAVIEC